MVVYAIGWADSVFGYAQISRFGNAATLQAPRFSLWIESAQFWGMLSVNRYNSGTPFTFIPGQQNLMLTPDQLQKYSLFKNLSQDDLTRLMPLLYKRTCAKGVYLFYPQSPANTTYLVESGLIRLFFTNAHGEEFLLNLLQPGEVFGLPVLQTEQIRLMGAAAYHDSTVLAIACADLLNAAQTMPQLGLNLYREASTNARALLLHARALTTLALNAHLAFLLLRLSHVWQTDDVIELPIHQAELAAWLGASRGRLNRALGYLQNQGIIRIEESRVLLLDRAELVRLAKSD